MLGRENISSAVTGLLELVKNAYDADATHVEIILKQASTGRGQIIISDDGVGMELEDLRDKWMVISTDDKQRSPLTQKARTKVGEKGIGRLALDRLCESTVIITHTANNTGLKLDIDWTQYERKDGELQSITHPLSRVAIDEEAPSGTTLYLTKLRDQWTQSDYQKLYDDLALLVPPFDAELVDFSIDLQCDEAPDISGTVSSPMIASYEYKLESTLKDDGTIGHVLTHRTGEMEEETRPWAEVFSDVAPRTKPACGPLKFVLYFYLRDPELLREIGVKRAELNKFLAQFQGIRIYRDNFRVKPYGEPGGAGDWLGLNLRQVKSPAGISRAGWVVGENQIVGSIFISREYNSGLQDKTNREGLIENQAYTDMHRFALRSIQFLEEKRRAHYKRDVLDIVPVPGSEVKSRQIEELLSSVQNELNTVVTDLRDITQEIYERPLLAREQATNLRAVASNIEQAGARIHHSLTIYAEEQTERQILLGLSTLGIAMTAFGHETARSVNNVFGQIEFVRRAVEQLEPGARAQALEDLRLLADAAERVRAWGKFALDRVRRDKRTQRDVNVNTIIREVLEAFSMINQQRSITVDSENLSSDLIPLRAFPMDIEAIIINLVTNAIEALRHTPLEDRVIKIETYSDISATELVLCISDSGRGINVGDEQRIFEPLFSTRVDNRGRPVGTGMGLPIVRDIIDSYQGSVLVTAHSALGGAEFRITLPYRNRRGKSNDGSRTREEGVFD